MSKKKSLEEAMRQTMTELPLPDENEAWQKMKALLDEKEKRRGFLFFKYEKIAAVALLLCTLLLWLALPLQTEEKVTNKDLTIRKEKTNDEKAITISSGKPQMNGEKRAENKKRKELQANSDSSFSIASSSALAASKMHSTSTGKPLFAKQKFTAKRKQDNKTQGKGFIIGEKSSVKNNDGFAQKNNADFFADKTNKIVFAPGGTVQKQLTYPASDSIQLTATIDEIDSLSADSIHQEAIAGLKNTPPKTDSFSVAETAKKAAVKIKHHNAYFVDAGVGIKQQIPIGGQRLTFYNYNGNKGWFGDYIPSVYIKLGKDKGWFLQGEFHYAAPRLTSNISFFQKTRFDYSHSNASTDKYYLQKAWYNEVPFSFNIYLGSSWSVGAGVMYNMLRGASANIETSIYDAIAKQSVYEKATLPWKGYTDSFLYKTNTSMLVQTDYHIDKWSFGLRYLHDVQPFLIYTLPNGITKDKRNASLEILVRYQLFQSKKF